LRFSGDSWTEVTDGRGQRLLYNLYRKGQSKQVTGKAPFTIFLGNAAAVTIEYNGQPYDASAHVHRNLARFQLGSVKDNEGNTE
jgi:cytoskeleton protein RodZ